MTGLSRTGGHGALRTEEEIQRRDQASPCLFGFLFSFAVKNEGPRLPSGLAGEPCNDPPPFRLPLSPPIREKHQSTEEEDYPRERVVKKAAPFVDLFQNRTRPRRQLEACALGVESFNPFAAFPSGSKVWARIVPHC